MPVRPAETAQDQKIARLPDRAGASSAWVAWLTARVHADAFLFDPRGYLQGVGWRVRGLKLRSRNRIAALAGRSAHAYDLWIARNEAAAWSDVPPNPEPWLPVIVPVIDCRRTSDGLDKTIASLDERARAHCILIGNAEEGDFTAVRQPSELADHVDTAGTWLCPLLPGDRLARNAARGYAAAVSKAGSATLIYADDDALDSSGKRSAPHFKPEWNPDLFEHHDFITRAAIVKAVPGDLRQLPSDGWAEHLTFAALRRHAHPIHVPLILHHRRRRPEPVVPVKPALDTDTAPLVSIIIPTRNQVTLLRACVEGISQTDYREVETIIIDNGSDDPDTLAYLADLEAAGFLVLRQPGPFNFSVLNNAAVKHAHGEMLCFMNNDVEVLDPDWLKLLVRQARRQEIGAVGSRLLYPDGTVQHAGVCTGIGGGAGHAHRFQDADDPGYFQRARLPQRVTAVTAACMVVAKEKYLAVGGFDEQDFPVAFNDVDLCLKLNAKGWQSFYEPRATLIHHESKSRGSDAAKDNRARFAGELAALKRKWATDRYRDPYHHPNLSPFCEQFFIAV